MAAGQVMAAGQGGCYLLVGWGLLGCVCAGVCLLWGVLHVSVESQVTANNQFQKGAVLIETDLCVKDPSR